MASSSGNRGIVIALVCAGLLAGCGGNRTAEEIRALRLAGAPDSARARAVAALTERASQMGVWREFAHASLDLSRRLEADGDAQSLEPLIEAALVSGSLHLYTQQNPGREWQAVGRLVAMEVGRRINRMTGVLATQAQAGEYYRQAQQQANPNPGMPDPAARYRRAVEEYRDGARPILIEAVILRRLIEALPEAGSGSAALLSGQMGDAIGGWAHGLELEAGFVNPIQSQTRRLLDAAFVRANEDLRELGYWLPKTILENGVES